MNTLELNKAHCGDCLNLLSQLEDNSINLIITSPPYNKGDKSDAKGNIYHSSIDYDEYSDNLPEDTYQAREIEWLSIAYKKLKPGGSLFYNHKERTNRKGGTIIPDEWLLKTPFASTIRQRIIWDRGGSHNNNKYKCSDGVEFIYWLTKPDSKGRVRTNKEDFLNEKGKLETLSSIWRFSPERDKSFGHPVPYPLGLPLRCLHLILGQPQNYNSKEEFVVLDPFLGSGTTGCAAVQYQGVSWLGFDISENYAKKAQERVDEFKKTVKSGNESIW